MQFPALFEIMKPGNPAPGAIGGGQAVPERWAPGDGPASGQGGSSVSGRTDEGAAFLSVLDGGPGQEGPGLEVARQVSGAQDGRSKRDAPPTSVPEDQGDAGKETGPPGTAGDPSDPAANARPEARLPHPPDANAAAFVMPRDGDLAQGVAAVSPVVPQSMGALFAKPEAAAATMAQGAESPVPTGKTAGAWPGSVAGAPVALETGTQPSPSPTGEPGTQMGFRGEATVSVARDLRAATLPAMLLPTSGDGEAAAGSVRPRDAVPGEVQAPSSDADRRPAAGLAPLGGTRAPVGSEAVQTQLAKPPGMAAPLLGAMPNTAPVSANAELVRSAASAQPATSDGPRRVADAEGSPIRGSAGPAGPDMSQRVPEGPSGIARVEGREMAGSAVRAVSGREVTDARGEGIRRGPAERISTGASSGESQLSGRSPARSGARATSIYEADRAQWSSGRPAVEQSPSAGAVAVAGSGNDAARATRKDQARPSDRPLVLRSEDRIRTAPQIQAPQSGEQPVAREVSDSRRERFVVPRSMASTPAADTPRGTVSPDTGAFSASRIGGVVQSAAGATTLAHGPAGPEAYITSAERNGAPSAVSTMPESEPGYGRAPFAGSVAPAVYSETGAQAATDIRAKPSVDAISTALKAPGEVSQVDVSYRLADSRAIAVAPAAISQSPSPDRTAVQPMPASSPTEPKTAPLHFPSTAATPPPAPLTAHAPAGVPVVMAPVPDAHREGPVQLPSDPAAGRAKGWQTASGAEIGKRTPWISAGSTGVLQGSVGEPAEAPIVPRESFPSAPTAADSARPGFSGVAVPDTPVVSGAPASASAPETIDAAPSITRGEASSETLSVERAASDLRAGTISGHASEVGARGSGTERAAQQVAEAMRQNSVGNALDVALHPEELGRVRLVFSAAESSLVVAIQAERPETLEMLRRHIDLLHADLRSRGFEDVTFDFGGRRDGAAGQGAGDGDRPPGAGPELPVPEMSAGAEDGAPASIRHLEITAGRGLDLRF